MTKHATLNGISSESVQKATGKTWDEWIVLLDKLGCKELSHKEIVRKLREEGHLTKPWWGQMVTVGYEYAHGKRVTGETGDAGFEIGVQQTFPLSAEKAWDLIISKKGMKVWLGDIEHLDLSKGYGYKTAEGTEGEIRTFDPGKKLRLTYKPAGKKESSTLQVTLLPATPSTGSGSRDKVKKTAIHFHHEKLSGTKEREAMRNHWQKILNELKKLL